MSNLAVGLIGCGRIATSAHLPAYRKYGIPVAAVCDVDKVRAEAAAREFACALVFTDPLEMASCEAVQIIDVATPPSGRAQLLRDLLAVRKPMLVQKPVTYSLAEATALRGEVEHAGVAVAVNHNARWSPVHAKLQEWIRSGMLGEIYALHHVNRFNEDLRRWYTDHEDYIFLDHGLHYFDLVRWHAGLEPSSVSALSLRAPHQVAKCALLYSVHLRFEAPGSPLVSLMFNNVVPAPGGFSCDWYVDGTRCSAHLTLDTIRRIGADGHGGEAQRLPGDWVPDGFYGAYAALAAAVTSGTSPPHSLTDHLCSLRLAAAAALSAKHHGAWVDIKDVT